MIQQQAVKRDPYFDSLKFILITLVVCGHAITCVEGKWANALYLWIYLFHMPLFIFVSGYFTKQLPAEKFKKGILGLAETLIVFQIISRLLRYFLEGEACSLTLLVTPFWILWYLMALILWRTILQITPPLNWLKFNSFGRNKTALILGISLLVSLLVGFTPIGYPLSLHRAIAFFPFFLMGYVARELNLMEWLRSRNKILCALLLLGAFVACYFLGGKVNRALFYFSAPYDQPIEALYRLVLLCGAISCGVAVLSICPAGDKLSSAGSNTMPIYIYHAYFISIFRSAGKLGLPQTLPSMLACTAVLLLFLVQVSKIRFFNEMLRPITMVRNWLRK